MVATESKVWRGWFVAGGLLYFAGGAQHPQGEMVEMLADPVWARGHATSLVGLICMTLGLLAFRRVRIQPAALDKWLRLGIVALALEAVEMAVHTAAYVDAAALAVGDATPVLTTHIWLATIIYPIFGIVFGGMVLAGVRTRALGSPWILPIGLVGAVAHGVVMPLSHGLGVEAARGLFPIAAVTISLWFVLAGAWPTRRADVPA
jgi:hypothetical protein